MGLAAFRIYLEIIGFDFLSLPLTKKVNQQRAVHFHRFGLIMSIGYILLFAPSVLLA